MTIQKSEKSPDSGRIGLCLQCVHAERVPHPRGGADYWRCRRADVDPRFVKYPPLPVTECAGYDAKDNPAQS